MLPVVLLLAFLAYGIANGANIAAVLFAGLCAALVLSVGYFLVRHFDD